MKSSLDETIDIINSKKSSLLPGDIELLKNLTSIRVVTDKVARRPFVYECTGVFTINESYINSASRAYLGSSIFHDSYHIHQYKQGGFNIRFSRGLEPEKEAWKYQLKVGRTLGLSQKEQDFIMELIENPELVMKYINTPP